LALTLRAKTKISSSCLISHPAQLFIICSFSQ
jgi:hypothetical protein